MSCPAGCAYSPRRLWTPWARTGPLEERLARRVPICEVCGHEQPARRPRRPELREVRAAQPVPAPLADMTGRTVAAVLAQRGEDDPEAPLSARGLLSELARRGLPASLTEEWLDRFLRAGWIAVRSRLGRGVSGVPALAGDTVLDRKALRELAEPGAAGERQAALQAARARVAGLTHPKALEIAVLLEEAEADTFPPPLLRALAALARHAESGEILAERVFAARRLGDSKALLPFRARIERHIGPLAEIGLREGAALTLIGGRGGVHLSGHTLHLPAFAPYLGLSRETLETLEDIAFPPAGLLVVENLTPFEACCRGEVEGAAGSLLAWSGGYPGRAVRNLVERAAAAGAPVRVWADLDLDGVRIARLISSWVSTGGARPWRMSPQDLAAAPETRPLSSRSQAALRRDLDERPHAPLSETLRAILATGRQAEQEVFLLPSERRQKASL